MKKVVTHNGSFHADDVFACATLRLYYGDIEITRTREQLFIDGADIVVDTGNIHDEKTERYDHHQPGGAGERDNGIPYASFGLVWKKYGLLICGHKEEAQRVDEYLVQPIDSIDNGVPLYGDLVRGIHPFTVNSIITAHRPSWKEKENYDYNESFNTLVVWAEDLISRIVRKTKDVVEGERRVRELAESGFDKRVVMLDKAYAWERVICDEYPEVQFVIYPRPDEEHWGLRGASQNFGSFDLRLSLPKAWAGLQNSELEKVTGVKGATFCHNKRFLCVAESKDAIIQLAQLALKEGNS